MTAARLPSDSMSSPLAAVDQALREADPSQNAERREVVFIDPRVADWEALAESQTMNAPVAPSAISRQLVIVDPSVPDYATLLEGLAPDAAVLILPETGDALGWLTERLADFDGLEAIHILSHGSPGALSLGGATLTAETLTERAGLMAALGGALSESGDLLLYGCNVAAGATGVEFVERLARATGADVAASEDLTGANDKGGDWVLEQRIGSIEAALPLMADAAQSYDHVLATFNLTGASGGDINIVKQTIGSDEIVLTAQDTTWTVGNENDITVDCTDLDGTIAGVVDETKVTITVTDGKTFDFSSIGICDYDAENKTLVITSDKGDVSYSIVKSDSNQSWAITTSDADAGDVSWIELKANDNSAFTWFFDNIVLDTAPTVTLSAEPNSIAEALGYSTIYARLSARAATATTVTIGRKSDSTAALTDDFTLSSTTITIAAGQTEGHATLTAVSDALDEADETAIIEISDVTGGDGATESGTQTDTVTITDDDPTPSLSIADISQNEGNSGTSNMTFTVSLSAASGQTVTVKYATSDNTATSAGSDYTVTSGTLTFAAGETSKTFNVPITGDTATEGNETFTVTLSDPTNATIGDATATGTINDDEAPTVASINRTTPAATTTNADSVTFTVTFSQAVTGVTADDFALATTDTATGTIGTPSGSDTTWTVQVTGIAGDGTLGLNLVDNDSIVAGATKLGGVGAANGNFTGQTYVIDNTAPVAPTSLDLAAADDTGTSDTDNLTKNTSALSIGGVAETDASVELFDGVTSLGTTTASSGAFSRDVSLAEGSHSITAKATDAAGNVSDASAGLSITVDTTAPVIASAAVNGDTLVLTYTEATTLDAVNVPTLSAFAVSDNTVTAVAVNAANNTVTLTLDTPVVSTDTVTIRYTDPTVDNDDAAIQDAAGNDAATITDYAVTNTTPAVKSLAYSATTFSEAGANDGSITTTSTITLSNDTFTGNNGDDWSALVTNEPAGLTASLIRTTATTATLSFTGSATAHANANDISNLTVTFTDANFTGNSAAAVTNAVKNNLVIDFADPAVNPVPMLVKDIYLGISSSSPANLTAVGGTLYFKATDGTNGSELWKSDGTEAGTVMVKDINSSGNSTPTNLTNVNGTLYFRANDDTSVITLWKSDGTDAGTVMVKNISPNSPANVNGTLYFRANNGANDWELWKSDGTEAGTVMVKDINLGASGSYPEYFANVNGMLYFKATDGTNGYELWKSDGTAAGTVMVKNIHPSSSSSLENLTNVNGTLYFRAEDGTNGVELWKSDGTDAGTVMVKDINTGVNADSDPTYLANVNGTLYFRANDGINGFELWKSDGTEAGTVMVKDIYTGADGSYPANLTVVNGTTLYFKADDGINGTELWKSDGTEAGTVMVKDIYSGSTGSSPNNLTNVNGTLYFKADDGINGTELWKSDGTADGTVLVEDIRSGSTGSSPNNLTNVNGTLYFTATDATNGTELWKLGEAAADTTAPTLAISTPADDATAVVVGSDIVLTFSEAVAAGTGNIVISDGASDTRTIAVGDAQVTISGTTVTINPTADFNINSTYYVQMASGVLTDTATTPNAFAGISDTTTLNFATAANQLPTLTSFSAAIETVNEDEAVEITLAELRAQGDEADSDGTVDAFVVKGVSTGSLKIGASAGVATAWAAGSNDTIDATHLAYWTPAANANGALNAFTVTAKDNAGAESATPVQATVTVTAVNDAPTISGVPGTAQAVTVGQAAALADFTVADPDGAGVNLTVTLTATNGTIGGVTDADAGTPGIQLAGTAAEINTALAAATFTAAATGAASVGVSVSDDVAAPVTDTYELTASLPANTAPTFSVGDGKVVASTPVALQGGSYAVLQPDGKIVIAGSIASSTTGSDFVVARFNPNGTPDNSFGTGGYSVAADFFGGNDVVNAVSLQADGKIVVAGQGKNGSYDNIALARFNTNGTLDTPSTATARFTSTLPLIRMTTPTMSP